MSRSMISRPRRTTAARQLVRHLILPTFVSVGAVMPLEGAAAQTANPAPAASGRVEGQAKDALDRPLAGVRLRLETPDGTVAGQATSDAGGRYGFTGIAP